MGHKYISAERLFTAVYAYLDMSVIVSLYSQVITVILGKLIVDCISVYISLKTDW